MCTFLSRWPVVNWLRLRASERNWFRTSKTTVGKKKKVRVLWVIFHNITLSYKMWLVPHTNKQQEANTVVVWLETDVGKKLPLTSFDATRVAWLSTVKVDLF